MSLPSSNPATIKTAGDYTTVAAWEADLDDATFDADYEAQITGLTADNSEVVFNGINSTSSYKAILKAASGEEADGTDAAGAQMDVGISVAETTDTFNFRIEGIEHHTSGQITIGMDNTNSSIEILKCVHRDRTIGVTIESCTDVAIRIAACLFRQCSTVGLKLNDSSVSTEAQIINNSFYGCGQGMSEINGTYTVCKNNAALGNTTDFSSAPSNQSYNCSSDTTANGTGSLTSKTDTDQWTAPGTDDFTVKDTDADIYQAGTAISGESWFPSTDLVGTTWASSPSMGCFEFEESGSSIFPNKLSVTIAGYDANVSAGKSFTSTKGSVSVAGLNASVSAGKSFTASTGTVAVTGLNANVSAGTSIAATKGSVVATGLQAEVSNGNAINATTGAVAITGLNANVSAGKSITATKGAVAVTGLQATVSNDSAINATTGAVVIQGHNATVSAGTSISATLGAVAVTGLNASISAGTSITATNGAVTAVGLQADVTSTTLIEATTGAVIIAGLSASVSSGEIPDVPTERIYSIAAENRVYDIENENRVYSIT